MLALELAALVALVAKAAETMLMIAAKEEASEVSLELDDEIDEGALVGVLESSDSVDDAGEEPMRAVADSDEVDSSLVAESDFVPVLAGAGVREARAVESTEVDADEEERLVISI